MIVKKQIYNGLFVSYPATLTLAGHCGDLLTILVDVSPDCENPLTVRISSHVLSCNELEEPLAEEG